MYFDKTMNEMVLQIPRLFPTPRHKNMAITIVGPGARQDFSPLMVNVLPDLHLAPDGAQCFPLYFYEKAGGKDKELFDSPDSEGYVKREAITDGTLKIFQKAYGSDISKEDLFFYVYGVLSSSEYRERYQADLTKVLPRIPMAKDFWPFSQAGRELSHWHLNYETVEPYPLGETTGQLGLDPKSDFRVAKMRFGKKDKVEDRSVIIYNSHLTLTGIPLEAYDYVVNGKPAIEWVMERYQYDTDKPSGIVNDPNDWSNDPAYIVNLVKRIVRVSVETVRILKGLPKLEEVFAFKK
ncbi:type III restriction endonuclease subunit R [Xanthomonas campestris pv. plantaginis]|nr:type III restriction endonuclease subunit R [Xanthomonas campestris pv. plantaginis]